MSGEHYNITLELAKIESIELYGTYYWIEKQTQERPYYICIMCNTSV